MASGSGAGSHLRLIEFVYHSTLGLRVIKKKNHGEPSVSQAELGVGRYRGGLVFKAHRRCVSLNSRLESNKEYGENHGEPSFFQAERRKAEPCRGGTLWPVSPTTRRSPAPAAPASKHTCQKPISCQREAVSLIGDTVAWISRCNTYTKTMPDNPLPFRANSTHKIDIVHFRSRVINYLENYCTIVSLAATGKDEHAPQAPSRPPKASVFFVRL